ncbi:glycosyltransferase [Marinomonas sp. GJ51-6]|uniref:glycosyltransferase n=1 Tax=Marinomonas sp. GJ51-6 TaxID=2992802 RepID=UPI0029351D81|nr:glycosyltransferase [Marinomonas sp. GJ51-6]WOD09316.1 glycosyltransferase [Marinomonas sp. GJ51-6]
MGAPIITSLRLAFAVWLTTIASYIEETINGFLQQKTTFPFEILIHDDASTDNTAEIIRAYQTRYPKLVKPIFQTENQFSKGKRMINSEFNYSQYLGQYICVCDGDDYWVDPHKLQTQADYLDANKNVVLSTHDVSMIDEHGTIIKESHLPIAVQRDATPEELIIGKVWSVPLSWMFRKQPIEEIPERNMVLNGDAFFLSYLGQKGSSHHHNDIKPSAYRRHKGGVWSTLQKKINEKIK